MAGRSKTKRSSRVGSKAGQKRRRRAKRSRKNVKSGFLARRQRTISASRLERGLRVLNETNDVALAARALRVSLERFKRSAIRKRAIRKSGGRWIVVKRLPRRMPIFSGGKQLAITVNNRTASLIGRYMSAVGRFLRTNDPKSLAEFAGRGVKDAKGKIHSFETNPNALYRLSSVGMEPFEDIYRIVL